MLCTGNSEIGEIDIKQGIFEGVIYLFQCFSIDPIKSNFRKTMAAYGFLGSKNAFNLLLFMDDLKFYSHNEKGLDPLVQTICVFSKDIGIEFGIEKCAMLVIEKGNIEKSVGIELPDGNAIKSIKEGESYKNLRIVEADRFLGQ